MSWFPALHKPGTIAHYANPNTWEDQEFKVILDCIASWRTAWRTLGLLSKRLVMSLILVLERLKWGDLYELKASLFYMVGSKPARAHSEWDCLKQHQTGKPL